jgi:aryl-alcohol dehydrogenase-like predicted oxidoreductase
MSAMCLDCPAYMDDDGARSAQILPIPGSGSPEHVAENIAAASIQLSSAEATAILDVAR